MNNNFFIIKENKYNKKNIVNNIKKVRFHFKKSLNKLYLFFKKHKNINKKIYKPEIFYYSLKHSSIKIKQLVGFAILGNLIGFLFLSYGVYYMATSQHPGVGGIINEVVINDKFTNFNPVIGGKNSTELKISNLLFSPLYEFDGEEFNNIMLADDPKYLEEDKTKIEFVLKEDLQWSNGEEITSSDVEYSFDRIKESGGDDRFHLNLQNLEFEIIDKSKFNITTPSENSNLLYNLNFRPVQFRYYNGQKNIGLKTDSKSFSPQVVSGDYEMPQFITNPLDGDDSNRQNPIRNTNNEYSSLTLKRRDYDENASYINQFNFIKADSYYKKSNNKLSLEDVSTKINIDIISGNQSDLDLNINKINAIIEPNFLKQIDSTNKHRIKIISNLNQESIFFKYAELYDLIYCDLNLVFNSAYINNRGQNCINEDLREKLFEYKDSRGFSIFSEGNNGKILYYKTSIIYDFIGQSNVIQFLNSELDFNLLKNVNINLKEVNTFNYDNLFLYDTTYDFSVTNLNIEIENLNNYNNLKAMSLQTDMVSQRESESVIILKKNQNED